MTIITDRHHLAKRITDAQRALHQLAQAWLNEDAAATTPTANGNEPTSGGNTSDPTLTVATRPRRTRHRDRLGADLHRAIQQLEQLAEDTQPRHPAGPCRCCHLDTATHGRDRNGQPTDCWRCYRFLRDNGHRCDDDIHQTRPRIRWCECPPTCCEVCPDKAEEGRQYSRRCRQRKTDRKWETDDHRA